MTTGSTSESRRPTLGSNRPPGYGCTRERTLGPRVRILTGLGRGRRRQGEGSKDEARSVGGRFIRFTAKRGTILTAARCRASRHIDVATSIPKYIADAAEWLTEP